MRALMSLLICVLVGHAWAVSTSYWVQTTEADFKKGTFKNVVATNLGDLKLSRAVKSLLGQDPRVSAVYCLAQAPDGTIYAGTGPEGVLLAIRDDQVTTAAELEQHTNLFSLLVDAQGRLLIGTGGDKGRILRIDKPGGEPQAIFDADGVQYVWAMARTPDGAIYAATGPNGQLFQINVDGSHKVVFDSAENNLLCLLSDGGDYLYVGSDPNGLVYRVNRQTGQVFVVYDAPESEISALVRDGRGNLYAATAESTESPGEAEGAAEQVGRPEADLKGVPIPSEPPPAPKPPDLPKPAPGEPLPIPKDVRPTAMVSPSPGDDRTDGGPGTPPTTAEAPVIAAGVPRPAGMPIPDRTPAANGNAIYRIDRDGFVTEVFRQNVMILAMLGQNGTLLVATGSEGSVYQLDPDAEETVVLAKVDSRQVLALLGGRDGRVFMGLANSGEVAAMTPGFAADATYISPVLDATQISRFGKIQLRGTLPEGTQLRIATRSGNVEGSSDPAWSPWSADLPAAEFAQIPSSPARFLQYRLTFTSNGGDDSPVVEEVSVAYQMPNLPPRIASVRIASADKRDAESMGKQTIAWEASDPNEDELTYSLHFRSGARGAWILMKDKLKDPTYDWDTRTVADGRYQVRVEASDASANPSGQGKSALRVSDPVVVDNTAPLIGDIKTEVRGREVIVELKVVDRTSTVSSLAYTVDGADEWQTVLPVDNIADSPDEAYRITVDALPPGAHQIGLRAADAKGNRAFETVSVTIVK